MTRDSNTTGGLLQHYGASLGLLTDLYQLTMAYGYWKCGMAEQRAVFHLTFRRCPFGGQYALASGMEAAADFLTRFAYDDDDCAYLQSLNGRDQRPLFEPAFLDYLRRLSLQCDVAMVAEGTAVFAHEPLLRVEGPLLQAQLLETPLLNLANFATLVATKASRVCAAGGAMPVLEFGLRRAQGIDGGLTASWAAHVGGCAATSNVLAGKLYGIPVRGTHAHSWVMAFADELESFRAYARAMPNNCVFLVDTYDTLEGVRKAAAVGQELRAEGHELIGVRLDSGDLGQLSRQARRILDEAGFPEAVIVASNDLDEYAMRQLVSDGSAIGVWGVGTKLATCFDQPALGGVYKLGAIRPAKDQPWRPVIKLSEQPIKVSNPGIHQIRRFRQDGRCLGDVIYSTLLNGDPAAACRLADGSPQTFAGMSGEDLLQPVIQRGRRVRVAVTAAAARSRAAAELASLPAAVVQFDQPQPYFVGLESALYQQKQQMMQAAAGAGEVT